MIKAILKSGPVVLAACAFTATAWADPVSLSDAQMDAVAAGGADKVDGFVCPVISTDAVLNSPRGAELGIEGYYTIGGPDVSIPLHATNGDGSGSPQGPFTQPGDTDYTAIWSR